MKESSRKSYWKNTKCEEDLSQYNHNFKLITLHFKWSPCSIKSDFEKLMCKSHIPPKIIALNNSAGPVESSKLKNILTPSALEIRPRLLLNHFEFHKELTRKDDLIHNLKTQLQHDCESLFDYTPISFHITIPEGRYSTIDHFI